MDEYERAAAELKLIIEKTSDDAFIRVVDTQTKDEDCRSIQTILTHVVRSGYSYANYIRDSFSITSTRSITESLSRPQAIAGIEAMLDYTVQTLDEKWEMTYEEINATIIHPRWGVVYNLEQLLEHAIVHILRHRRQVEKFLRMDGMS